MTPVTAVGWCAKSSTTVTPPALAALLHPALHAPEAGDRGADPLEVGAGRRRGGDRGEAVLDVEGADEGASDRAEGAAVVEEAEGRPLRTLNDPLGPPAGVRLPGLGYARCSGPE